SLQVRALRRAQKSTANHDPIRIPLQRKYQPFSGPRRVGVYKIPLRDRPSTRDCLFLSTHEPCSLCLSAITWAGFDNFFYFFGYEATRDAFKILSEVFRIENGDYARQNAFWTSRGIEELVGDDEALLAKITELRARYDDLSAVYQDSKAENDIPLS
ncbi:MAG: hypothetical protein P8N43_15820, partial [Alphaproteobacteria bacterium]|nr:hypothetical protein [Alphaproteobacteria bacterium]